MELSQTAKNEEIKRHEWSNWIFREDIWIQGKILSLREPSAGSGGNTTLDIQIDSVGFEDALESNSLAVMSYSTAGRFRLDDKKGAQLQAGDRIQAKIRLYPSQDNLNPGSFRYKTWLHQQGFYLQGVLLSYKVTAFEYSPILQLREVILDRIEKVFSLDAAPFLKAFILGDKSSLEQDEKEAFSRAGLSHIMAVSGLHVGFLLTPFWMTLPYFRRFRFGSHTGILLLISILALYASLTGFSTSVNRASVMAVLLGVGSLYGKVRNSLNQLFVAATGILLIRPNELFEPGFQLSFGAVALLLLWMPTVQEWIETRVKTRALKAILLVMSVTMVVQTGLTPILAYWFGELSLVAPLSNLVVVPLLSFLMPGTILLLVGAPLLKSIPWAFELINGIVNWILLVSEYAGRESLALRLSSPSLPIVVLWVMSLGALLPSISPRFRWRMVRIILLTLLIVQIQAFYKEWQPKPFRVVVLDVGQGDALFFETPRGKRYMVDSGGWSPGWNSGIGVIIPFLKSENIDRLEGLFLTHPHADHIGGAAEILSAVRVDTVYRPPIPYDSELNNEIDRILREMKIPERSLRAGEFFMLGDEIQVYVLNPVRVEDELNPNNASLVMKWRYGEVSWMLTGDAEHEVEERILDVFSGEKRTWLESDVLKVGHHGSKTSTTSEFLKGVSPQVAVVPVAFRNRYRHPHREVTDRLQAAVSGGSMEGFSETSTNGRVYFTSLDGPLYLFSDSEKIREIRTLKER